MRDAKWIVISDIDPAGWKAVYPAMSDSIPRERIQFEHVLGAESELVARYGWFELRRHVPGVGEAAYAGIVK
jgi:hypothetical protein